MEDYGNEEILIDSDDVYETYDQYYTVTDFGNSWIQDQLYKRGLDMSELEEVLKDLETYY